MPKTAVSISLKASDLGRSLLPLVYGGLLLACLLHPHPISDTLVLLPLLLGIWHWYRDFGPLAPVLLEVDEQEVWLTDRQGVSQPVPLPLLWRSRHWLVFRRGVWPWILWPDAVSAAEHHQLRVLLKH
ncbi:hypothetical protein [Marinospirillum alkaliphilum]|uniref:Uncharacterized protein n=1 Tax=Marinospirillum alkaliphilum DSM 21637 TaxID=1122209 RepID=A0A1K1YJT6_9GAMM|nr:hypothetical protein [Marinospirillum alkaliphilum]SFX62185.1 hypothetical protein SAMN02745752_02284 [Marinospirillum alkaliphilum DSM 21637]